MKICKIESCNKKHYARGYCQYHYSRHGRPFNQCGEIDCIRQNYARELCHTHYEYYRRKPTRRNNGDICQVPKCKTRVSSINEYCGWHRTKIEKGLPLDKKCKGGARGSLNGRWNGGTSEYPDHYTFKKNRLIVLKRAHYKCEECGKYTNKVHHKDLTKTNHVIDNLMALCGKCHMGIYHADSMGAPPKYSPFTVQAISIESGIGIYGVRQYFINKSEIEQAIRNLEGRQRKAI